MLQFAVQFQVGTPPKHADLLAPLVALVVGSAVGLLLLLLLQRVVPPIRRRLRAPIAQRRVLRAAATAEIRSRAMMDELCPYGWQAQIILFGTAEDVPPEAPDPEHTRVQLLWSEAREATVVRAVWAPSIPQALDAMVAERITDETLQSIEHQALADGAAWPDADAA